jgi:hypothetical protein
MVVDVRQMGGIRNATVTLDREQVFSYTPVCGNAEAGFASCHKTVYGSQIEVSLLPGEGMLVELQLFQPAAIRPIMTAAQLWSRKHTDL